MLLFATAAWVLHSASGRDRALAWLVDGLPAGTELHWQHARGTLAGGLRLEGVRLRVPASQCVPTAAACVVQFDAGQVRLDIAPWPLLRRRVQLRTLRLDDARLTLPDRDTPFELPQWPALLPALDLPLGIAVDTARVQRLAIVRGAPAVPVLVVRMATFSAALDPGALQVTQLHADTDRGVFTLRGHYLPRDDARTDLVASWARPHAVLAVVARGNRERMDVAASARAPERARLWLRLQGDAPVRWQLRAASDGFDPLRFTDGSDGTPWRFAVQASGEDGHARLQGRIAETAADGFAIGIAPSRVQLGARSLGFAPLQLALLEGQMRAEGMLRFDAAGTLDLSLSARGLRWGTRDPRSALLGDADLRLAGTPSRWTLAGNATLQRGRERATVTVAGRGDRTRFDVHTLRAVMPQGRLDANGTLAWSPRPEFAATATLAGFDPGYFLPDWPGTIRGIVHASGAQRADGSMLADVEARDLAGRLRGRALAGHGHVRVDGTTYRGDISLRLGASRIEAQAQLDHRMSVQARFAPLLLDDLLPDASGRVQGTLQLDGARAAPDLTLDLHGDALAWRGQRAATLVANGHLPARGSAGTLHLGAEELVIEGVRVHRAAFDLDGALDAFHLAAVLEGDAARAALVGDVQRRGSDWRGTVATLALEPARGPAWALQAPVAWQWQHDRVQVGRACLHAATPARVCVSGGWPLPGMQLDAEALPLALLDAWWTPRDAGLDAAWRGRVDMQAHVANGNAGWRGTLTARGHDLALRTRGARYDTLATPALALDARFDAHGYDGRISGTLAGGDCGAQACRGGPLQASVRGGWAADAPLVGQLDLDTDSVTWLELLSPDLVSPQGRLNAQLRVAGTRGTPLLSGEAHLDALDAELPALALSIRQGRVDLIAAADGSATLHGALPTGRGALAVTGTLDWHNASTPLSLRLQGANVLIADTPALFAVVSPDLALDWQRGGALKLAGRVEVDEARMDLQRLTPGVGVSADVVVLDPADPDRAPDTPLALDLQLIVGDKVTLSGYGLDGHLTGTLAVRGGDGVPMRGRGELTVRGRYRAYGSQLEITRGQLWWRDEPLDDPQVALRAERRVGDVRAGLDVNGRLSAPRASAWTEPASSEQDALAYLALGRPLSSLGAADAGKVDAAQAALNAGGGLLASQLAAKIGLDDAGVSDSRALGGQVFGIGKQLSPRLYVSYGVSLIGSGQVVLLRYLLGRGFDVQIESSTRESRGSLNWRKEH